jgi:hypothetical protein
VLRAVSTCLVLGVLLVTPGVGSVAAGPELDKVLSALGRAKDPKERLRHVRQLVALRGPRAASALARLVRSDPSVKVRVGAARALGLIQAENALELLLAQVRRGGVRAVRAAVGDAARRRPGSAKAMLKLLAQRGLPRLERGLVLRALGAFDDESTKESLRYALVDPDLFLRGEAARAVIQRARDLSARRAVLTKLLTTGRELDTLMPALDAASGALHPVMRPALARLRTFLDPPIKEAAEHLLDTLDAWALEGFEPGKAGKPGAKDPDDRYGGGEGDPPTPPGYPTHVPPTRAAIDMVFVLDATGSTGAVLPSIKERVLHEMDLLRRVSGGLRVGVVIYRGGRGREIARRGFEVLPLTYDADLARDYVRAIEHGGVDDRGRLVGRALQEALDKFGWRWHATRTVQLYADTGCGDLDLAREVVATHYRADRTRTRIAYVLRTRSRMPEEYADLARLGGSGAPEAIK